MDGQLPSIGWSPTAPRRVTNQPDDGSVLQTQNYALRLNTQNEHQVSTVMDIGWSPKIPRRVTHQPKDGQPPKGSVLQLHITHIPNTR